MDQVINADVRKQTFLRFITFFIITVALIVAAVYFDTLVPEKENEVLRMKIGNMENQVYRQKEFMAIMEKVKDLNDSLVTLGSVHPLLDREIAEQLNIMNKPLHLENSLYGTLNKDIFNLVYEYTEMNKRQISLAREMQEVEQLKSDLNATKSLLEDTRRSLDAYRNSANLGVGSQ